MNFNRKIIDTPIRASGFVFFMHFKKALIPIPGSMIMGIAPILNRENAIRISSYPGLTAKSTLSPLIIFLSWRNVEHLTVSSFNSLKVRGEKELSFAEIIAF